MRRHAILIGVNKYDEFDEMPCAANDVHGIAKLLTSPEHGLFSDPIIFSHHPDYEIKKSIHRIFKQASSTDEILLYYSGHGEVDMNGQLHLVTRNTEKDVLESSSIPARFIRDLIDKSRCERVMLILDCCFSGAVKQAFKGDVISSQLNSFAKGNGKGICILTASSAKEPAKQGTELSILTRNILTGIQEGKADLDQDGFVSMSDLFDYVKDCVPKDAPQTPTSHHYGVEGNKLFVARAHRAYSTERLRAFKKIINDLDSNDAITPMVIAHARKVIEENQQKRDKDYFELLSQLCNGEVGSWIFSEKWLALENSLENSIPPTSKQDGPLALPIHQTPSEVGQLNSNSNRPIRRRSQAKKRPVVIEREPETSEVEKLIRLFEHSLSEIKNFIAFWIEASPLHFISGAGVLGVLVIFLLYIMSESFCSSSPSNIPQVNSGTISRNTKEKIELGFPSFTESLNGVPLEMVFVPKGKFSMGGNLDDSEKPTHVVNVPSFYIAKYEVTQQQWQIVMGSNPSNFKGDDLPVEEVNWSDAKEFCEKLSKVTGIKYRLPSEAEWEYACRAGTAGDYAIYRDEEGWYGNNSGKRILDAKSIWKKEEEDIDKYSKRMLDNGCKTHRVGLKAPNKLGLYDMFGNVAEWCEDLYHENYTGAPEDGSEWSDKGSQDSRRVLRGGSWRSTGDSFGCFAHRFNYDPSDRNSNIGFRVVVSANPP